MNPSPLVPASLNLATIGLALTRGRHTARLSRRVSLVYAGMVALIGFAISQALISAGRAPLLPFAAGAFMLVGPILLAGFFGIARAVDRGQRGGFKDLIAGFRQAPPVIFVPSLVCLLLFMIYATDIAILYSYLVGGAAIPARALLQPSGNILSFLFFGGISGIFLGLIVFAVTAFSLPLLWEGRAGLVPAVSASVRCIWLNLPLSLSWAALITLTMVISVILPPLLPFTLPPLAYASHALYRLAFPLPELN